MNRLYVYAGAIVVIGLSFGADATLSLWAGQSSIPLWMMAVGGTGMVLAAVYEATTTDPADFRINTYHLGVLLLAAALILISVAIQLTA